MRLILKKLKKYALPLTISFVLLVLSTLCSVALPTLMTNVVDKGVGGGNFAYVVKTCAWMAVVTAVDAVLIVVAYKISNHAILAFDCDLRKEIFEKVCKTSLSNVTEKGESTLLTRSIDDADRIGDTLGAIISALSAIPFTLALGTVLAFKKDAMLAGILLLFTPVVVAIVFFASKKLHIFWKRTDECFDKQGGLLRSRLSGIRIIRAFNKEKTEHEKIVESTRFMSKNIIRGNVRSELIAPLSTFVLNVAIVLILYVGSRRITLPNSALTAGGILAVIEYVGMITSGILAISYSISDIPRMRVNCQRVAEILKTPNEEDGKTKDELFFTGNVRLDDVSYAYVGGGANALDGVSLEIQKGQTVAFIGGTGAGKSTLIRLLCGLDEPTEGKIFFDGEDISLFKRKQIRKNVACVLQKDTVFSGKVREIVGAGERYSDEEILSALKDAQIAEFFMEKTEGIDYEITERGGNLSGGQKQRLTIARAIIKDAPLYIFDDSFSALDFMTESKLRQRLKERLKGKTQIIVTQRISSAKQCDQIFLFDGGKLSASGTHEKLMEYSATYREIYLSQTGGENA